MIDTFVNGMGGLFVINLLAWLQALGIGLFVFGAVCSLVLTWPVIAWIEQGQVWLALSAMIVLACPAFVSAPALFAENIQIQISRSHTSRMLPAVWQQPRSPAVEDSYEILHEPVVFQVVVFPVPGQRQEFRSHACECKLL